MTEEHLQLHGQSSSNGEEASGIKARSRSWLELKKVIAEENHQGEQFRCQLVQYPELDANFMASL